MEDIILVGYGGHAKSVADSIMRNGQYNIVGYTDMVPAEGAPYTYLGNDDVLQNWFNCGVRNAVVCLGYLGKGDIRERLYKKLKSIGYKLPVIIDPSAIISSNSKIGEGTFVGKGAIVNAESEIGKMCIVNTKALIEHECKIEDFSHIAVGAVLCGQVRVGKAAFVGANATVIQCRIINEHQLVPAGVVVR